jgi:hypothetical protein
MEAQEQFSPELCQAACSSGENAAASWRKQEGRCPDAHRRRNSPRRLQGRPGSGEVQTRWPKFIEEMARARKAEIEWVNGVWGEAPCHFIGAWTSGGSRAAINRHLGGVSSLRFEDERGGEDSTRRLD